MIPTSHAWRIAALTFLAAGMLAVTASAQASKKKRGADGKIDLTSELPADAHRLQLGESAPDFHLKGVDGKFYSLASFQDAPVLMVVFLSNHCPYSHAAETRLIPFAREFAAKGLAVVAINPNNPEGVDIGELGYSKYSDSYEEMIAYAKEAGFPFPYVYDGETQKTARAYGCLATPHVFLFDHERKLRYAGRVDDSRFADPATVKTFDARNAVVEMLAGKPVSVATTPVVGCATKWMENKAEIAQIAAKWERTPVTLETIDAAGVAQLAANPTKNVRLINVWATWCAPCVAEFPGFVSLARRLNNRDFEFISLSMDDPKLEPQARSFLEKQHAATPNRVSRMLAAEGRTTNNYLYREASTDALIKALDPQWPGPLPHTVVIAPGGKIIYRHNGPVDMEELRAKVIEALGPYYTPDEKR
jgi:thiol-disulfide isomerase/thioredoxin